MRISDWSSDVCSYDLFTDVEFIVLEPTDDFRGCDCAKFWNGCKPAVSSKICEIDNVCQGKQISFFQAICNAIVKPSFHQVISTRIDRQLACQPVNYGRTPLDQALIPY